MCCNPQINSPMLSCHLQTCEEPRNICSTQSTHPHTLPADNAQGDGLPYFTSHTVNKHPLLRLSGATFFFVFFLACLCFLLVILLFRMTPPGAVLKRYLLSLIAHKKVMMRPPEEIHIRQVTTVKQGTTLFEICKIKN